VDFQSSSNNQALNSFLFFIPKFRKFRDVTTRRLLPSLPLCLLLYRMLPRLYMLLRSTSPIF
jgi:hypothetical protein